MRNSIIYKSVLSILTLCASVSLMAQTGTPINGKTSITTSGDYYLANDIVGPTLASFEAIIEIASGINVTLDMNGHTLDLKNTEVTRSMFCIRNYGKLTIKGTGTLTNTGESTGKGGAGIRCENGSSTTIDTGANLTIKKIHSRWSGAIMMCDPEVDFHDTFFYNKGALSIENCEFDNEYGALTLRHSKCTFESSGSLNIKNCTSQEAAAIYNEGTFKAKTGSTLSISDCSLSQSMQGHGGGAISNQGGVFTVENGVNFSISGCNATRSILPDASGNYYVFGGGAIYNGKEGKRTDGRAGVVTLNSGSISGCYISLKINEYSKYGSYGGGAIMNRGGCTINLNGCDISECHVTANDIHTSNVCVVGGGGILSQGTLMMSGGKVKDCYVDRGLAYESGGGISIVIDGEGLTEESDYNSILSKFDMTGGEISGNKLKCTDNQIIIGVEGAGVFVGTQVVLPNKDEKYANAVFSMRGGTICNNETVWAGGGISFQSSNVNSTAYPYNGIFTKGNISGNKAHVMGGGINTGLSAVIKIAAENDEDFVLSDNIVDKAVIWSSNPEEDDVDNGGGGLCLGKNGNGTTSLTFTGGIIKNNRCNSNGGGIYLRGGESSSGNSNLVLSGGVIKNNVAGYGEGNVGSGGGVYTRGKVTLEDDTRICNNIASGNGGGIAICSATATFVMTGGTITENKADFDSGDGAKGSGGGVFIEGKTEQIVATISNGTISDNISTYGDGGGVYIKTGNLEVSAATIKGNKAVNGGAFYVNGGNVVMNGGKITLNNAVCGAGMYSGGGTITLGGTELISNTATGNGGGLYSSGGSFTFNSGKLNENKALDGAGIYVGGGSVNMTGGEIIHNISSGNGAGIHVYSGSTTISGGQVNENEALNGNGGGFYSNGGTLTFDVTSDGKGYGKVMNNKACNGGAVYLTEGASMSIVDAVITGNHAIGTCSLATAYLSPDGLKGVGGGVYVGKGTSGKQARLEFTNTERKKLGIYLNVADMAADDIFADASNTVVIIPKPEDMNLTDYSAKSKGWYSDYIAEDPNFPDDEEGFFTEQENRGRYSVASLTSKGAVRFTKYIEGTKITPAINQYVCFTLGIDSGSLLIKKTGLLPNESAIFTVTNSSTSNPITRRVVVTGIDKDGSPVYVKLTHLEVDTWTVTEEPWSWAYTPTGSTKTVTIEVDKTIEVEFSNNSKGNTPRHGEDVKENNFSTSGASINGMSNIETTW